MSLITATFKSLSSYPKAFWFLCIHMLLFMSSFSMLLPELNDYITSLGGEDMKWGIMGFWTIAAGISRPLSGKIADNISRKSVMWFGVLVSILIACLYPLFTAVYAFLIIRFLHGFSTGFQPTGASALVADVIPEGRRGEAMGIFGVTFTIGFSVSQSFSHLIVDEVGMDGLFYSCAILGVISLIPLMFVKEDKSIVREYARSSGNVTLRQKVLPKSNELLGLEVYKPAVVMFLTASLAGMYFLLIPDLGKHLGYDNKGYFWLVYVGFTVVTRLVGGKLTDKWGAKKNLYICCSFLIVGSIMTGTATTAGQFELSAIFYAIGSGIGSPALFAWTADLSDPAKKGRGMGTLFIALEFGLLTGNVLAQLLYDNKPEQFDRAFLTGGGLCLLALLFLISTEFKRKSTQ